jgi:hypothetical protein
MITREIRCTVAAAPSFEGQPSLEGDRSSGISPRHCRDLLNTNDIRSDVAALLVNALCQPKTLAHTAVPRIGESLTTPTKHNGSKQAWESQQCQR